MYKGLWCKPFKKDWIYSILAIKEIFEIFDLAASAGGDRSRIVAITFIFTPLQDCIHLLDIRIPSHELVDPPKVCRKCESPVDQ